MNYSFLYKDNNKLYYGRFEFNTKLQICWYEFINNKYLKVNKNISKYEHPYEEMAYTLTENLDKFFK